VDADLRDRDAFRRHARHEFVHLRRLRVRASIHKRRVHSWATAFLHPQDAVDAASRGNQVRVAEGRYTRRNALDRSVLEMKDDVRMYVGYPGYSEPLPDSRNPAARKTRLDGDEDGDNSGDMYHVVIAASNTRLDGFWVARGTDGP